MVKNVASVETKGIKTVETSIAIVEALQELGEARMTDIANKTGLSKASVYKHLVTLVNNDFVVKDGCSYRLGFRYLDIGGELRFHYPGATIIRPKIKELAEKTNEVGLFEVRENDSMVTLFRENSSQGVFTRTRLGKRMSLHHTAGGKSVLAHMPDEEVRAIIDETGLPAATENSITDEGEFFDELDKIRDRGYAVNRGESTPGVVAVAAPVIPDETVLGACAVTGPQHRLDLVEIEDDITRTLLGITNEIELNIVHSE